MHDSLFSNQTALAQKEILDRVPSLGLDTDKLTECLSSSRYADDIQKNTLGAHKMGIIGTPTFILGILNDDMMDVKKTIMGAYPYETFNSAIDELLASTNSSPITTKH